MPDQIAIITVDMRDLPLFKELIEAAAEVYERPYNDEAHDRLGLALQAIVEQL